MIKRVLFYMLAILVLSSCDSSLTPDYMLDSPRIIALQVTDPEVTPGAESVVSMRLFIGGREVDQSMSTAVVWFSDPMSEAISGISQPYTENFSIPVTEDMFSEQQLAPLKAQYDENGWTDIPVTASITVNEKRYDAMKFLRLTKTPLHKNPKILSVSAVYLNGDERVEQSFDTEGAVLEVPAGDALKHIGFRAATEDISLTGNDKLLYRWYVTVSHENENRLYKANNDNIFPDEKTVDEISRAVVFSLRGENGKSAFQEGSYDLFLVVRDKAQNANDASGDRRGLAVFTLKIRVMPENL